MSRVWSVSTKQNWKEVSRNTSNQFIKVKYFHVQTVNTKRELNSLLGDIWSQFIKCSIVTNNNRAGQINSRNAPETPEYAARTVYYSEHGLPVQSGADGPHVRQGLHVQGVKPVVNNNYNTNVWWNIDIDKKSIKEQPHLVITVP